VNRDPAPTAGPSVSTPVRVPGSARRTTSIEMDTRDGLVLAGRARDLVTPTRGDAVVVDEAAFQARLGDYLGGQIIEAFTASPTIDGLEGLIGRSASRGFRRELQRLADEQGMVGRPIFQPISFSDRLLNRLAIMAATAGPHMAASGPKWKK